MEDHLARATGPGAHALLRAVLGDADVRSWRLRQVDHRPGRSTTATWDVRVRDGDGERTEVLGVRVLPDEPVSVWRFPDDPDLPGLAAATDDRQVRALLDRCGSDPGPVELRVRSYRPGRRAVVEVRTAASRLFVKVLPAHAVAPLHDRHVLLRAAGLPVPRSLGWRDDGLVVLEALSGTSLRARLREGAPPDLDGTAVLRLLDALPVQLCALPQRRSWSDDVEQYATITAAALPA